METLDFTRCRNCFDGGVPTGCISTRTSFSVVQDYFAPGAGRALLETAVCVMQARLVFQQRARLVKMAPSGERPED
jgi:hypothetical protein